MSNIPIVQGVAVSDPYEKPLPADPYSYQQPVEEGAAYYNAAPVSPEELRQLRQNPRKQFQDVVWAIAFVAHLVVLMVLIIMGLQSADNEFSSSSSNSFGGLFFLVGVTGLTAVGLSCVALSFMMKNTETLVQTSLIFSVVSSGVVGVVGFVLGDMILGILGVVSFLVGICYARIVWPRIPFAAANLQTAVTAIQQNMGLMAVAMGFTVLAFGWTLPWFLGLGDALAGSKLPVVFFLVRIINFTNRLVCLEWSKETRGAIVLTFSFSRQLQFLSYYWVHQVCQNTVHVTTAGTVATWWFVPDEASSWWSQALTDSLVRSTTYSFGSICFGSFLVALVQALRALEHYARDNDDFSMLLCLIQCILQCIERIIEYINRWAYVYVGMYGFSYLEAGRNVVQLFQNKGWTVVITDDLADNVLFMMQVAIGLASGLLGLALAAMDDSLLASLGFESNKGPGFLVGFLAGFFFSTVLLSVVGSAINTVIVCK